MEAGSVFTFAIKEAHHWVILSDPRANPDAVLIVHLTSWRKDKEQTCIIEKGEHECIVERCCVYYEGATITTLRDLFNAKDGGVLKLERLLMPADVLKRIREGVVLSDNVPTGAEELLRQQGLIK